ncbi:MAG: class I SAM-dependent methyltransferase [Bacteroidia bacterium]
MKAFWDERYAEAGFAYGQQPNAYFQEVIQAIQPGKLLLPCEGEGRQAVYAAQLGWEVTAFDQSSTGRQKALAWATEAGVALNYVLADAVAFETPTQFDLVALIFAHLPEPLRAAFHQRMAAMVKPGGLLLIEGFSKAQLGRASGGPRDEAMLFSTELLAGDFAGFDIISLGESRVQLNEGPYHQGEAAVVRLLARKMA